jgi:hypothetical protein
VIQAPRSKRRLGPTEGHGDEERTDQRNQRRKRRVVEAGDRLGRRQSTGVDLSGADIPSTRTAGHLNESQLTWIVSAAVWGWITARSEQDSSEGLDPERAVRVTNLDPDPWDLGAVKAILPELAKSCAGFDWSKPANKWTKDELAEFLLKGFNLIRRAYAARDRVEELLAGKPVHPDIVARQVNRTRGNPAMTVSEIKQLNDGLNL